jgi:sugar lactone lactonase YvrE
MGNWVESQRSGTKSTKGMTPRTLALIMLGILLLIIAVLLYYVFFVLPKMGGGVIEQGQQKVGRIEFLFAVYGPGTGSDPYFLRPMGVACDSQGNMYVTDSLQERMCVFNKDGRYLFQVGGLGVAWPPAGTKATWKPGLFNAPYGIDVDDRGDIYVADCQNQQIQVFNGSGKFLRAFPKPWQKLGEHGGGGRGEGLYPTVLTVHGDQVYVCDAYQIAIFKRDGTFVRQFGQPGRSAGHMDRPNGIAVGSDGTIYVSDSNHYRLQAFTNAGVLKWEIGNTPANALDVSENSREFGLPRGIAVDGRDNIFVADAFHFSIEAYDKTGKKIGEVGTRGVQPGEFNFPNDICITNTGVAYITDRANQRVQAVRIPGLIIPPSQTGPFHFPWWVLLLLIPPLVLAYLLMRKPRFIADEAFLTDLLAQHGGELLDRKVRRVRVTPEVLAAVSAIDAGGALSDVLKATEPNAKSVQALAEDHELDPVLAETLAVSRRSLMQRLLAVQVVLFVESAPLSKVADELGAEVVDVATFLEVFADDIKSPTPEPEAAA